MLKSKYEEFTIENLIRLFQNENDEKAFDQILKNYYHLILGTCLKLSKNKEDAKDLTLEICTLVWEKLQSQSVNNFNPWLYSICYNHCMDFHRNKKNELDTFGELNPEQLDRFVAEPVASYEEEKDGDENETKISELIATLPADQKTCMRLFYIKKLSYNRISTRTGYSMKKIKSALQSGRTNLRKAINL